MWKGQLCKPKAWALLLASEIDFPQPPQTLYPSSHLSQCLLANVSKILTQEPWLAWLSGLSIDLCTERLPV